MKIKKIEFYEDCDSTLPPNHCFRIVLDGIGFAVRIANDASLANIGNAFINIGKSMKLEAAKMNKKERPK